MTFAGKGGILKTTVTSTTYLGNTLFWEKGRQLKSFSSNVYTYNANGIRTSKTVNGVKHSFILDGAKILGEYWDGNTLIPLYDNEDNVCGILYGDIPYYFLKNLQGDVIAITNQRGETVAHYTYDAWGACTISYDTTATPTVEGGEAINIATVNPFRYRSYYFDTETGLYYLQSRYYDPALGRFVNGDCADYVGQHFNPLSDNLFAYCENKPVMYIDITGESLTAIAICAVVGLVIGAIVGYGLSRILKVPKGSRWKYVLGGAVIGAIVGACVGYAVFGVAGSTSCSGIVLWSGSGKNGVKFIAADFARDNGLKTLGMTKRGKILEVMDKAARAIMSPTKAQKFMRPFWSAGSKSFIRSYSKGQEYVHVFIDVDTFSEESIFAQVEYKLIRELGIKIVWHFVE